MENHEMETDDNNNEYMMKTNFESSIVNGVVNDGKLTLESLDFGHFLSILDHLDANSLMELCKVNDQFRNKVFFYKHILGSKLFEIDEFVDVSSMEIEKRNSFFLHRLLYVYVFFSINSF